MIFQWLRDTVGPAEANIKEGFENTVDEVLDLLFQDAVRSTGKQVSEFTREAAVISYLETKGAFLIRYPVDRVAELLNLSKFTIYNYLDEVKATRPSSDQAKSVPAHSAPALTSAPK
jgi:predicted transcriptional regulator YheO